MACEPGPNRQSTNLVLWLDAAHAGDVVTTGMPPRVGHGSKPPVFLKAGDVVELGIDGLGKQRQIVTALAQ